MSCFAGSPLSKWLRILSCIGRACAEHVAACMQAADSAGPAGSLTDAPAPAGAVASAAAGPQLGSLDLAPSAGSPQIGQGGQVGPSLSPAAAPNLVPASALLSSLMKPSHMQNSTHQPAPQVCVCHTPHLIKYYDKRRGLQPYDNHCSIRYVPLVLLRHHTALNTLRHMFHVCIITGTAPDHTQDINKTAVSERGTHGCRIPGLRQLRRRRFRSFHP